MSITVINQDGSEGKPTDKQRALLDAAQKLVEADTHFQQLKGVTFSRAEVNAGMDEAEQGYLYMVYSVPGAVPQEFWAHWSTVSRVAWKSGNVSVKVVQADPAPKHKFDSG